MGFPGGIVDFVGTKREWHEETGLQFPKTCDIGRFVWYHNNGTKTGIYIGKTYDFINIALFKPNSEIASLNT
jgi:hypothetical protein